MVHHGDTGLRAPSAVYTKLEVRRPFRHTSSLSISRPGDLDFWPFTLKVVRIIAREADTSVSYSYVPLFVLHVTNVNTAGQRPQPAVCAAGPYTFAAQRAACIRSIRSAVYGGRGWRICQFAIRLAAFPHELWHFSFRFSRVYLRQNHIYTISPPYFVGFRK